MKHKYVRFIVMDGCGDVCRCKGLSMSGLSVVDRGRKGTTCAAVQSLKYVRFIGNLRLKAGVCGHFYVQLASPGLGRGG